MRTFDSSTSSGPAFEDEVERHRKARQARARRKAGRLEGPRDRRKKPVWGK